MDTRQLLVAGKTGTGKTQLVRKLVNSDAFDRVLVMDRLGEDYPKLEQAETLEQFTEAYGELRRHPGPWKLRNTWWELPDHLKALRIVNRVKAAQEDPPPLLLVMEEASFFSDTGNVPGPVQHAITKGRHYNISVISVAQRTAQVHPDVQDSASHLVLFKSRKPGSWLKQILPDASRLARLEELRREDFQAGRSPERGVHYIVDPELREDETLADVLRRADR